MGIKKIFKSLKNELIYGGHVFSLGIISINLAISILLNLKITWEFVLLLYAMNQSIYLYNYYKEFKKDRITKPERSAYIRNNRTYIQSLILLYIITTCVILIYSQNWIIIIFGFFLLSFSMLYSIIFKRITKYCYGFKNFFVALFWGLTIILLSLFYGRQLDLALLTLLLFIFLIVLTHEIMLDIKDISQDKKNGLLTLAIVLDKKKLFSLLILITILAIILIIYAVIKNYLPKIAVSLIFIAIYNLWIIKYSKQNIDLTYIFLEIEKILFFPLVYLLIKLT